MWDNIFCFIRLMRDNIFVLHVDCVITLAFYVIISGRFGSCERVESERI